MRTKQASNSFFLEATTPLFSRELLRPLRLMSLVVGIGILIAGSIWTPSIDWDVPLCFVIGLPAYVLAPWAFRQLYYLRWKWIPLAGFAMWFVIDGVYSAYWTLMGFDSLAIFRPANFFYCIWFFWISGLVWNIDLSKRTVLFPNRLFLPIQPILAGFLIVVITSIVGLACGFLTFHVTSLVDNRIPVVYAEDVGRKYEATMETLETILWDMKGDLVGPFVDAWGRTIVVIREDHKIIAISKGESEEDSEDDLRGEHEWYENETDGAYAGSIDITGWFQGRCFRKGEHWDM